MGTELKDLSCPFTWGMESVIGNQNGLLETKDDRFEMAVDKQDDFPESVFMYHLMLVYEKVMSNDMPAALQSTDEAEQKLDEIIEKKALENVENVLRHIHVATKCHVLEKLGRLTEVDNLLRRICHVKNMNNTELAMLNGCQCVAWSYYFMNDNMQAINYAKTATQLDPNNGKWWYLLGKNYRRMRRPQSIWSPYEEETAALKKAYELSKNPLYGVSLGQSYRESQKHDMANQIYIQVYALEPTCCSVRLQLALGFIRAKDCSRAKDCLDFVGKKMPDSVLYTHYMGIYEEKCNKDFKAALDYYERTTAKLNFGAEWQYIQCKKRVEPNWDPLVYMFGLIKKYASNSDYNIQGIYIQIGFYYLFKIQDVISACQYLTKAIKIQPHASQLKKPFCIFPPSPNVYDALSKEVQRALRNCPKYNDDEIAILKEALQLCHPNLRG